MVGAGLMPWCLSQAPHSHVTGFQLGMIVPPETFSSVWSHLWSSLLGRGCFWCLVCRGGTLNILQCTVQTPSTRNDLAQSVYSERWRNPLVLFFRSVQFSSLTQSCPTLCDPMNRSSPGLPVHHQLPEFMQTQIHRVSDTIQPSHPLSSPSPPAPNPSQHQSLFQWVNS